MHNVTSTIERYKMESKLKQKKVVSEEPQKGSISEVWCKDDQVRIEPVASSLSRLAFYQLLEIMKSVKG